MSCNSVRLVLTNKLIQKLFDSQDSKHLTVSHVNTLKMNDDVLAVAVSPDAKYIAVALLDSTVKVSVICSCSFLLP